MKNAAFFLSLFLAQICITTPIRAADQCVPSDSVAENRFLTFDRAYSGLSPIVDFVLRAPLSVDVNKGSELTHFLADARKHETSSDVVVPSWVIPPSVIDESSVTVRFDGDSSEAFVTVESEGRYYRLPVKDSRLAKKSVERALKLVLPYGRSLGFVIPRGTEVKILAKGRWLIPAGEKIRTSFDIQHPLPLMLAEPARLPRAAPPQNSSALRIEGTKRAPRGAVVRVIVENPGFDFGKDPLSFCLRATVADGSVVSKMVTDPVFVRQSGARGVFDITLPDIEKLSGWGALWPGLSRLFPQPGHAAELTVTGIKADALVISSSDKMTYSNSWLAGVAGLLTIILSVCAGLLLRNKGTGFLVGRSGAYSLSNLQIFIWTLLVLFAVGFTLVTTGELLDISPGILVLLGISGATSVLSRQVESAQLAAELKPKKTPMIADLVQTEQNFDLLRFQMLGFTIVSWLYAAGSVLANGGFPEIPENFYLLMGLSNVTYLGGKLNKKDSKPDGSSASDDGLSEFESTLTTAQVSDIRKQLGLSVDGGLDTALREAVQAFARRVGIAEPADGRLTQLMVEKIRSSASSSAG